MKIYVLSERIIFENAQIMCFPYRFQVNGTTFRIYSLDGSRVELSFEFAEAIDENDVAFADEDTLIELLALYAGFKTASGGSEVVDTNFGITNITFDAPRTHLLNGHSMAMTGGVVSIGDAANPNARLQGVTNVGGMVALRGYHYGSGGTAGEFTADGANAKAISASAPGSGAVSFYGNGYYSFFGTGRNYNVSPSASFLENAFAVKDFTDTSFMFSISGNGKVGINAAPYANARLYINETDIWGIAVDNVDEIAGYFSSTNSRGIYALSTNHYAGQFISTNGIGIVASSGGTYAGTFQATGSNKNALLAAGTTETISPSASSLDVAFSVRNFTNTGYLFRVGATGIMRTVGTPTSNSGLIAGEMYMASAATIALNGDLHLAVKQ